MACLSNFHFQVEEVYTLSSLGRSWIQSDKGGEFTYPGCLLPLPVTYPSASTWASFRIPSDWQRRKNHKPGWQMVLHNIPISHTSGLLWPSIFHVGWSWGTTGMRTPLKGRRSSSTLIVVLSCVVKVRQECWCVVGWGQGEVCLLRESYCVPPTSPTCICTREGSNSAS